MVQNKKQTNYKNNDSYNKESEKKMAKQHNRSMENLDYSDSGSDTDESISSSPNHTPIRDARKSTNVSAHSITNEEEQKQCSEIQKSAVSSTTLSFVVLTVLTFIAVVLGSGIYNYDTNKLDIMYLRKTYPWQSNDTWDNINAVIDDIRHPSAIHPAVFLFLYNSDTNNISKLVHDVARYASDKLDSGGDFIEMAENEFHSEEAMSDYGYLIDKYAQEMSEKKVMVVQDLQNIPGHVAQAFHSFCDEISPLVESVVYIFTLKVNTLHGKKEAIAEYYLKQSWKDLDEDKLLPLVTRVTGSVF